jgi:hypothetical protein
MDIKRKTCDIRTREKHLFLDISSTGIDTLVPIALPARPNPQHRNILSIRALVSTSFVISQTTFATQL